MIRFTEAYLLLVTWSPVLALTNSLVAAPIFDITFVNRGGDRGGVRGVGAESRVAVGNVVHF